MVADWSQLKTEYVTTQTSYRKLAQKYGINHVNIAKTAKADNWVEARKQYVSKLQAKMQESAMQNEITRAAKVTAAADQLTDRLVSALMEMDMTNVPALKQIASALKDVREIYGLNRTKLDEEEQKARIKALEAKYLVPEENNDAMGVVLLPVADGELVPPEEDADA